MHVAAFRAMIMGDLSNDQCPRHGQCDNSLSESIRMVVPSIALQMLQQSILPNTVVNNSVLSALSKNGLWQEPFQLCTVPGLDI